MVSFRNQFFGDVLDKLLFSLERVFSRLGQAYSFRDPKDMRIDGHGRFIEDHGGDDIGGFSSYTGEFYQIIYLFRNDTIKELDEFISHTMKVFSFVIRVRARADVREDLID